MYVEIKSGGRMRKARVRVDLIGGLGNQLFQYVAGMYILRNQNVSLELNCRLLRSGNQHYESLISDFELTNGVTVTGLENQDLLISRKLRQILNQGKKVPYVQAITDVAFGVRLPKGDGYDPQLQNWSSPLRTRGYFQTWKYIEQLQELQIDLGLKLKSTSKRFEQAYDQIQEVKPIVLHVRRGDYQILSQTFGLLSREYYGKAIDSALAKNSNRKIWVISDDINNAKKSLAGIDHSLNFRSDLNELRPSEILYLQSFSGALIIANSSFSWWAAMLSGKPEIIYCPDNWFRNYLAPQDLVHPRWNQIESSWE